MRSCKYEVWKLRKACGVVKYEVWRLRKACGVVKYEVWKLRKAYVFKRLRSKCSGRLTEL